MEFHFSAELVTCPLRWKWGVREDGIALSSRDVLCRCRVTSQVQLIVRAATKFENWFSKCLTKIMINSFDDNSVFAPEGLLNHLKFVLDQSSVYSAVAPITATAYQLVKLYHCICAEGSVSLLIRWWGISINLVCSTGSRLTSFHCILSDYRNRCHAEYVGTGCCTLWSLCFQNEWHQRKWVQSQPAASRRTLQTNVQYEKAVGGGGGGSILCDWGYRCNWQPRPVLLPNLLYRRVCFDPWPRWGAPPFSRIKAIPRPQHLRLETPGWRVVDFEKNPMAEEEKVRQQERIWRAPLVVQEQKHPYADDIITDNSVAQERMLPVLAKVASAIHLLRLGGSYELFLVLVYIDCDSSEHGRYLVRRWCAGW